MMRSMIVQEYAKICPDFANHDLSQLDCNITEGEMHGK